MSYGMRDVNKHPITKSPQKDGANPNRRDGRAAAARKAALNKERKGR